MNVLRHCYFLSPHSPTNFCLQNIKVHPEFIKDYGYFKLLVLMGRSYQIKFMC